MVRRISLDRLRETMRKHEVGLDNPEGYALADKALRYCRENKLDTVYGTVIVPTHFGSISLERWSDAVARAYFEAQLDEEIEPDEDVPVWRKLGTPEFNQASADLLHQKFVLAQAADTPLQLYVIEDAELRQVRPVLGNRVDVRRIIAGAVINRVAEDGVGLTESLTDAMLAAYYGMAVANGYVVPPPKLLGQPGDMAWCLHRATIQADSRVAFPHIRQFLDRLNDADAFAAWLYGVYSGRNKGRQMLYISDTRGEGGKSRLIGQLVSALFADRISASYACNKVAANNPHASAAFIGKRLVVVGDNKNSWLFHTALFKELSGDDSVFVNPKYTQPFSTKFDARALVTGNVEPAIVRDAHNTSRTLWLILQGLAIGNAERDPQYGEKCVAELPGFLAYGERCYAERCLGNDYAIEVNAAVKQATERRIRVCETMYSVPFDDHFTADPDGTVTARQWTEAMRELRYDEDRSANFRSWVSSVFPVIECVEPHKPTGWFLQGIRLKRAKDRFNGAQEPPGASAGAEDDLMTGARQ